MDYSIAVGSKTVKEVCSFFAILGPAASKYNSDQERTAKNGEKLVTWWPEVGNRFFLVALSLFVLSCNCAILRVKWKAYSPPRFSRYRWLSLTISPPPPPPYKFLWIMCWVGRREVISPLCSLSLYPSHCLAVKPCMECMVKSATHLPLIYLQMARIPDVFLSPFLSILRLPPLLFTPRKFLHGHFCGLPLWKLSILVLIFHPSNPSTSSTKNLRFR